MARATGFGSLELIWVVIVLCLFTLALRLGLRAIDVNIGWALAALGATMAAVVLLVVMGAASSLVDHARGEVEPPEPSARDARREVARRVEPASFPAHDRCVRILDDPAGNRRVRILVRDAGTFYFQEESLSEQIPESHWTPVGDGTARFYDSEETAVREARANVDWLASP